MGVHLFFFWIALDKFYRAKSKKKKHSERISLEVLVRNVELDQYDQYHCFEDYEFWH